MPASPCYVVQFSIDGNTEVLYSACKEFRKKTKHVRCNRTTENRSSHSVAEWLVCCLLKVNAHQTEPRAIISYSYYLSFSLPKVLHLHSGHTPTSFSGRQIIRDISITAGCMTNFILFPETQISTKLTKCSPCTGRDPNLSGRKMLTIRLHKS